MSLPAAKKLISHMKSPCPDKEADLLQFPWRSWKNRERGLRLQMNFRLC